MRIPVARTEADATTITSAAVVTAIDQARDERVLMKRILSVLAVLIALSPRIPRWFLQPPVGRLWQSQWTWIPATQGEVRRMETVRRPLLLPY
jgi:hypothetical protein